MNILFLTFGKINNINEHTIYCDLLREFIKRKHNICTLSPGLDVSSKQGNHLRQEFVNVDTFRGGKNLIKKGISTISVDKKFLRAIQKKYSNVRFDAVIYTTPPITLCKAVEFVKNRDGAKTYLLLKDIFPQNAVDIGLMSKIGIKGFIYRYFRRKEKKLYDVSDRIGCMSNANVDYVLKHNPNVTSKKISVCPNSIEVIDKSISNQDKDLIRKKYGIPLEKTVFVYGGNLGKPQDIPFVIKCIQKSQDIEEAYFVIAGDGSEYDLLKQFVDRNTYDNAKLIRMLPKEEYNNLVAACDVGLIFLDHHFTIPNFPSRLLSYMQAKLPVLACTDSNTDIGRVIIDGGFGWWCGSDDIECFTQCVNNALNSDLDKQGNNAYRYLKEHYNVKSTVELILRAW